MKTTRREFIKKAIGFGGSVFLFQSPLNAAQREKAQHFPGYAKL